VIAASGAFPELETLNLHRNELGDAGAVALAGARHLGRLSALYVGQNNITDAGAVALIESSAFSELATLDLVQNPTGEDTMIAAFKRNKKDGKIQIITR